MHCLYCNNGDIKEATEIVDDWIRCCKDCAKELPPHPCPFNCEIHEDDKTLCTCCAAKMHECYLDT